MTPVDGVEDTVGGAPENSECADSPLNLDEGRRTLRGRALGPRGSSLGVAGVRWGRLGVHCACCSDGMSCRHGGGRGTLDRCH